MNARKLATAAILLAIGVAVGRSTGSAAEDEKKKSDDSLVVQCAKAELRLAEMNYQWVQNMNKKVPGTLIGGMVQQFSEEVKLAQVQLEIAQKVPDGDPYLATLERMKLALRSAESRAQTALETHEKAPNVVSRDDVLRTRQMAIITDLELQRGMALKDANASEKLAWQLEVLGNELDRVRKYAYLLGQNRVGQFSPGGF